MSQASVFEAVKGLVDPAAEQAYWDLAEICLQRTAGALHEARVATPAEIAQAISITREAHAEQIPSDLLEVMARIKGHGQDDLAPIILELGNQISMTMTPIVPLVPFAGKLVTTATFYETYDHLHRIASVLLSPVIYVEDTDAIGTASANPIAASILASEITSFIYKRLGIRPFVSVARLDYESWMSLSRKHFDLE
jgi:hypothetical protein